MCYVGGDTKLVMDILRYGANVKVIGPDSLKARIVAEVDKLRVIYALQPHFNHSKE